MAAIFLMLFCALLFLQCMFTQGDAGPYDPACKTMDIVITQKILGVVQGDVLRFEATINNTCSCPQEKIMAYCKGFNTENYPDPAVLAIFPPTCLINQGLPVYFNTPLKFTYTWMSPSHFPLMSSHVLCP
ncbi:hypothetical protein AMTRI_Chr06g191820 [Amborella trichopoda]